MKTYPIITNVRMPKKPRITPPKKIKNQTHFTAKKSKMTTKKTHKI